VSQPTVLPARVSPAERRDRLVKTGSYYAAFIGLGLIGVSLGPTLPGLAEQTRSNLSGISFLFTARSLGYMLGSFLGGRLYDRVPGHPVMGGMLLLMAAMAALAPVVPLLWLLTAVLLVLGVAEGILDVGGNTLLVWVHGREVGPFMNGLHFFFGIGAFLSPIIIAQAVLLSGDITWAYWSLAILVVPMALWLLRLPSPADRARSKDGTRTRINYPLVLLFALFFFLHVAAEGSFGGWIYTYALAQNLAGEATAAYLTSTFWGGLTAGRLLAIPLAARLRPRTMLFGDLVGCLVSVGLILAWPHSLLAAWIGTFGMGLAIASLFPTSISFAERRMRITGEVTGWLLAGASLGGMTVPWLIGQFFESIGPTVAMIIILADVVIAVGVLVVLLAYSGRTPAGQH
jgi:MFS transporter, FHS family, Na+ dependent glucose transporter 1